MASGLSETEIYNMVLDRLAEESVLATTDEKAVTRWLNRNYPLQRDVLLQRHPWNFALKRATLAESTSVPDHEWRHQYVIPEDCLRVLPIMSGGSRSGQPVPFVVEGGFILTDATAPLRIRYIFRQKNVALFTPVFIDLLSQILAANFSHWLTGKASFAKQLTDIASSAFLEAARLDSLEGAPDEPIDDDLILVR